MLSYPMRTPTKAPTIKRGVPASQSGWKSEWRGNKAHPSLKESRGPRGFPWTCWCRRRCEEKGSRQILKSSRMKISPFGKTLWEAFHSHPHGAGQNRVDPDGYNCAAQPFLKTKMKWKILGVETEGWSHGGGQGCQWGLRVFVLVPLRPETSPTGLDSVGLDRKMLTISGCGRNF